jgi:transposase
MRLGKVIVAAALLEVAGAPVVAFARPDVASLKLKNVSNETGTCEQTRKYLARNLIVDVRAVDARMSANTKRTAEVVKTTGSTQTTVDGIGPVLAGRILGRTRRASRFASGSQFAAYTGTAPIEVASAERARHRLSRGGDRQLNAALHLVVVTQVRMRTSPGRAYHDRKIAEGKTRNEAWRCSAFTPATGAGSRPRVTVATR